MTNDNEMTGDLDVAISRAPAQPELSKEQKVYNLVCAWQHFAGKPIKSLEHVANCMTDDEVQQMEKLLFKVADSLEFKEDRPEIFHEFAPFAAKIREDLNRR